MPDDAAVRIRPTVSWPRLVRPNASYLMTVDVELAEPDEAWPYEQEEYTIGCVLDGGRWSVAEAIGQSMLVLHRFGGTYGPVRFALHVGWGRPSTPLRLILLTGGGVPFHVEPLPVVWGGRTTTVKKIPAVPAHAWPVTDPILIKALKDRSDG